jgi:hypothetical protein
MGRLLAMADLGSATTPVVGAAARPPIPRQSDDDKPTVAPTWRERIGTLFPEDLPRPSLARQWYWAALAVLLGALISLGRVPSGPGVLNTIWAEDGSDFLTDALNRNAFKAILRPLNGYFVMGPRILAIPASLVPIEWGPAVLTAEAALVTGLMAVAVYLASRQYLRHPLARLVAAAPVLVVPVGENVAAATANNVATLQFAAVYVALWMVLWVPVRRGARIASAVAVFAVCVSTFLAVLLLPLAVLRLYARRDKTSAAMVGSMLVAFAGNVAVLSLHLTSRPVMLPSRYDPVWALSTVAKWALPHALFGYGISGKGAQAVDPSWLIVASWPIVPAIILVALLRLTRPQWKLAAVMGTAALALLCATLMQYGGTELRYVVAPELMLFAALVALLLPRPDRPRWLAWAPLVTLSVCVALVLTFSYRTASPRTTLASWPEGVARARIACQNVNAGAVYIYPSTGNVRAVPNGTPLRRHPPTGFPVLVACDRLR